MSNELASRVYIVTIKRLDNGYMVESEIVDRGSQSIVGHYCSNLKGVTAELYKQFESKSKMRKDQVEFLREAAGKGQKKEEKSDA